MMLVIESHLMDALLFWATSTAVLEDDEDKTVLIETILVCIIMFNYLVANNVEEIPLGKTDVFQILILKLKLI